MNGANRLSHPSVLRRHRRYKAMCEAKKDAHEFQTGVAQRTVFCRHLDPILAYGKQFLRVSRLRLHSREYYGMSMCGVGHAYIRGWFDLPSLEDTNLTKNSNQRKNSHRWNRWACALARSGRRSLDCLRIAGCRLLCSVKPQHVSAQDARLYGICDSKSSMPQEKQERSLPVHLWHGRCI